MSVSLSVSLSVCLSVYLFIYLSPSLVLLQASNRVFSPSYFGWWVLYGPAIMTPANTQTYKQVFLSLLCSFLSDVSYSSGYMETANTSFSSIFESWPIYHSLKKWNGTTICCQLKWVPVTSQVLLWKVEKSETLKCSKGSVWPKKDFGRYTFSSCGHLLLHTLSPHWEQLETDAGVQKKTLCRHLPLDITTVFFLLINFGELGHYFEIVFSGYLQRLLTILFHTIV